jgi:hypothetical protein
MATLTLPPRTAAISRSGALERLPVSALAALGGALAVGGAAVPWLSLFAGLQPVTGLDGMNGQVAAALGATTLAVGLLFLATGSQRLRWLLGLLGFGILGIAGWSGINLLSTLAELQADPFLVAQPGPGVAVLATGGALVFATMFSPTPSDEATRLPVSASAMRTPIAASLTIAGFVHLAIGPEPLAESIVLGTAMIAAGVAQIALAVLVARRAALAWPLILTIVLNAAFVVTYIVAVTVGLAIVDAQPAAMAGMPGLDPIAHVDAVTPLGIGTIALEVAGAALAAGILVMRRAARRVPTAVDGVATPAG